MSYLMSGYARIPMSHTVFGGKPLSGFGGLGGCSNGTGGWRTDVQVSAELAAGGGTATRPAKPALTASADGSVRFGLQSRGVAAALITEALPFKSSGVRAASPTFTQVHAEKEVA